MSELRSGYQQSDVGVIPEDWSAATIADVGRLQTGPFGTVLKASEYSDDHGVPLISVGEIKLGKIVLRPDTPVVDTQVLQRLPRYLIREGDILFGRKGGVDRSAPVSRQQDGWFLGSDGIRLRPSSGYASQFLAYQFQTQRIQHWLLENSVGTTMPSMNEAVLSQVGFPIPSTEQEQKAIAEALGDADALIEGMEALIAKKRDIKQGAMQELLTGDRRLPGFQGEWLEINLAKLSHLKARIGWQGLTTEEYLSSGDYHLVTGTDFVAGRVDWERCCFVERERFIQDPNIQLKPRDILLTKDGTIGKVGYVDYLPGPSTLNSGIFVIRPKNASYDPLFVYYVLCSGIFDAFLNRLQAGSTIVHLYQKDLVHFKFRAPSANEQCAIAAVLSDMDAEIVSLEDKLIKARAVKQGMMQVLLTGEIRLI